MLKHLFKLCFGLFIDDPAKGSAGVKDDPKAKEKPVKDPVKDPEKDPDPEPDNRIPYDRFKKVNDENKALKEKITENENIKTEAEKKKLVDEGKWQEAAELAEKKSKEAEEKITLIEKSQNDKSREFEIAIEAKNQGINDIKDAVKLIDIKDITIDEDGTFTGIKEAIEKLKTDKPYLFDLNGNGVGVHSDKPKSGTVTTREELLADPIKATEFKLKHPAEFERIANS